MSTPTENPYLSIYRCSSCGSLVGKAQICCGRKVRMQDRLAISPWVCRMIGKGCRSGLHETEQAARECIERHRPEKEARGCMAPEMREVSE